MGRRKHTWCGAQIIFLSVFLTVGFVLYHPGPHRVNVTICVKYVGVTNVTPRLPIVVRHARSQSRLCFFHKCPNTNMILSYINVRLRNCLHRTHQLNGKSTNEKGKTYTFNSFHEKSSLGNTTMFHNGEIGSAVLKTSKGPNIVLDFMIYFFFQ